METVAVIDFETTGMSPEQGARATEIAAVLVRGGRVVGRYQSLMNAGAWVPPFIEELTGISNGMLADAPPVARVMREAAEFVGECPLVAHNASFDRRFWDAELGRLGLARPRPFACTLLLSRRVYPHAPNHKLGTLARHLRLPPAGRAHRALADAETAAGLFLDIGRAVVERYRLPGVDHALLCALQSVPRTGIDRWMGRFRAC
jgi:DNA polymerase-3 subunit epsilon